jgi:hypothetical protein
MSTAPGSTLRAALTYADLGYPVFPCAPGRKTPLTEHGLLDATTDAEQIETWWEQSPNANVALRTDGLIVIDVDGRDNAWLHDQPAKARELDVAPVSLTPRGGQQYFFRQPDGRNWRNTAGQLANRVDTRANGGYVVVAPSIVGDTAYRWLDRLDLPPPDDLPLPPKWLLDALDRLASREDATTESATGPIPTGQRNATLARLAGAMRRVGMSQSEIVAALQRVNDERCRPPLQSREVARVAESIARYSPDTVAVALIEDHYAQDLAIPEARPLPIHELLEQCKLLRPPVIQGLLRRGETMNLIAPPKTGKALAIDTPILTESGWMTMGDLRPGMRVHAGDGSLTTIVAASEVLCDRRCYRVTTRSGASVVADEHHQWVVLQRNDKRVVTTAELAKPRWGRRWLLPIAGALERSSASLQLDPWLLGYWLGNGTAANGELTINCADFDEIVERLRKAGFEIGRPRRTRGAVHFTVLGLKCILRRLSVLGCKHIPEAYLQASRRQRAHLLAGLLDADGHATTRDNGSGAVEFSTSDPELFMQVLELARSLGHKASGSVGRATFKGVDCGHKLRIQFAASRCNSPFSMRRRTTALPQRDIALRSRRDAVVAVIPVASVPTRCIQVAHPSGTFLAGREFMVTHNSWLALALAMAVASGRPWLSQFNTVPGSVLILDNELHRETLAHRVPQVAAALDIRLDELRELEVQSLRGQLRDIFAMGPFFESLASDRYALIVLDAFYRFMPRDMDENDNGTMASVYNRIDALADALGCCFVLIHHTTKGNQAGKSVTDVGAGAGSQSRAADAHVVLRPHEEPGAVVLDAAVRSWAPVDPIVLRWTFPVWRPAPELDPECLKNEKANRKRASEPVVPPAEQLEAFVERFVSDEPQTRSSILQAACEGGLSERRAQRLLHTGEELGLIHRWSYGSHKPTCYATVPKPVKEKKRDIV